MERKAYFLSPVSWLIDRSWEGFGKLFLKTGRASRRLSGNWERIEDIILRNIRIVRKGYSKLERRSTYMRKMEMVLTNDFWELATDICGQNDANSKYFLLAIYDELQESDEQKKKLFNFCAQFRKIHRNTEFAGCCGLNVCVPCLQIHMLEL